MNKPCETCKTPCKSKQIGIDEGFEENSDDSPCYDCGSTIPEHHTPLCDLTLPCDVKDLPAIEGTQWWDQFDPDDHD